MAQVTVSDPNTGLLVPIGGAQAYLTAAPTVTAASAYSAGNCVGGLLTFASAFRNPQGSGLIRGVLISDRSNQKASTDVIFFNANPASSTFTDKAAVNVNVADLDKICAIAHVTDWTTVGTAAAIGEALSLTYAAKNNSALLNLYAVLVTRGTPTFTAITDVVLNVYVQQD